MSSLRVRSFIIVLILSLSIGLVKLPLTSAYQQTSPKSNVPLAVEQVLAIDDGMGEARYGGTGDPGFGWFNLLKPDNYPATITQVQINFSDGSRGVPPGSPLKLAIYLDPEADGPNSGQKPDQLISITCNNPGTFETYTLVKPMTINSGGFFVGVIDPIFIADLPAFGDFTGLVKPIGSQSYVTLDNGLNFLRVDQSFPSFQLQPVTWLIRAVVDAPALKPVINRAFYKKDRLRVIGRNFSDMATDKMIVRINNKRIDIASKIISSQKFTVKATADMLNLNPIGQSNKLVVIVDGVASDVFEFTS